MNQFGDGNKRSLGLRQFASAVGFAVAIIAAPLGAHAVTYGSNDGSGSHVRTATYSNGGYSSGSTRSYSTSKYVYPSGKVEFSLPCTDKWMGRYAPNTNSTSYVTRGGSVTVLAPGCHFDNLRSRLCRDISGVPDPCGTASAKY